MRRNRDFTEDAPTRTHLEFGTPKSNAGHRTIPLTTKMQELIQEHRKLQAATRLATGEEWNDNDLVFCTELGTPYELRNLNRVLHRTLKKAGLYTMGAHSLRHSRAMHLYQHGMELALVSQWLGHANLETTLIYAHADTEMKRRAIEKASSDICNVGTDATVPDSFDDDTLKRLYGLR